MQTIYLDISNKGVIPTVYAKQNDVGRKFAVILTDSGLPYIPSVGSVFSVWYKGASGEGNYTDIGDKSAFSLNGNKVEVEMIVQMLSAHGDGILCLTLNSPNGNQISSWNIPYMCEIVPGSESEKAEGYYTAFSESVEKLKQVTENLTPEAIGAAPAGYVSGEYTASNDEEFANICDTVYRGMANNTSNFIKAVVKAGKFTGQWTVLLNRLERYNGSIVAWSYGDAIQAAVYGGVLQPFEMHNPPMVPGVEYRTTERIDGKVVYKIRFSFGQLPSNGVTNVATNYVKGVKNLTVTPNIYVMASDGVTIAWENNNPAGCNINVDVVSGNIWWDNTNVVFTDTRKGFVTLAYTKE